MELIIDIPNKIYEEILKNKGTDKSLDFDKGLILEVAVENGTPLEDIRTDVHRHKMDFYPSDYTLINTLIDKWINKGVNV